MLKGIRALSAIHVKVIRAIKLENQIVVKKKGQATIPVKVRRKYNIEEGTRLEVVETEEGILLKPKKTIWDMIGAYPDRVAAEKIDKLLYKIRHEEEDA